MNRRSLLFSAGAATLAACASVPRARGFALAPEIDAAVDRAMTALAVAPGLSIAVYSRDGVYARGFGVTDVDTGERATADTAFYIASSTKPLTALALATLAHRGELDLDQTLAAYAADANFPEAVRPGEVKLRDLLTHTHGIENDAIVHRTAFSGQHDPQTLWRLLASCEANEEHGLGAFEYTNVGYNIATILTDRRLGVRWQDLLARELFAPAGMTRATAIMSQAQNAGWSVAKPHRSALAGGPRRLYLEKTDQTMQSAGGVIISANDAARWLELMIEDGRVGGRQIIPAEVVQSTRAPLAQVGAEFEGYQRDTYGLGWYAGPHRDERLYHHFGGFAGFRAHVSYIPARGIGVAAFVNDSSAAFPLPDAVANYIYDRTAGRDDADARLDAAIEAMVRARDEGIQRVEADRANRASREWTLTRPRAAYAGAYENDRFGRIEVSAEGETLNVRFGVLRSVAEPFTRPDSIRVELVPYSGSVMLFAGDGDTPEALLFQNERFTRM
mgnify:CR=1 FL=1